MSKVVAVALCALALYVSATSVTPKCKEQYDNMDKTRIGSYIPQCDNDGNYKPVQCHGSTGMCWCADTLTGAKIPNTETRGTPTCGVPTGKCAEALAKVNRHLIGSYIPQCDANGDYKRVQCHASTGMCWCADTKTGEKESNTEIRGTPKCDAPKGECSAAAAKIDRHLIGAYVPQCDENGDYRLVQCHASTGMCWCADSKTGAKHPNTEVRGSPKCDVLPTTSGLCAEALAKVDRSLIGSYIPQCDEHGDYQKVQCHASTAYCWCADTKTGVKVPNTDKRFGRPECA